MVPRKLVRILLLLIQVMYLGFYFGALANLGEIHDIFLETRQTHPAWLISSLVVTATVLIPVRLFLFTAVALDYCELPSKFGKLFPILLVLVFCVFFVEIVSSLISGALSRPRPYGVSVIGRVDAADRKSVV